VIYPGRCRPPSSPCPCPALHLSQFELFKNFSAKELDTIQKKLVLQTYRKGQWVLNEGEGSRDLYLLTKGSMTVKIHLPERNRRKRLFTHVPGIIFWKDVIS
jgi:signal-transduction protein with cAMP-binding, CBS, and nucleotidyltransferase domain